MASYLVKPGTSAEDLAAQREYAAMLLQQASSTKPVGSWTQILAQMAQGGLGGWEMGELGAEGRRQQTEAGDLFDKAISSLAGTGGATAGGGAAATVAAPTPASPAAAAAAAAGREIAPTMGAGPAGSWAPQIVQVESGGRDDVRNPRSSATGRGQFIDSTWLNVMKGEPEAAGKTPQEILALRTNGPLSERMTAKYAGMNQDALRASGMAVTPGSTYLAHFLGPGGARSVLSSRDNVPVNQVLPAQVLQANPHLAGMTVGDVKAWADRKMERAARVAGGAQASAPAAPGGGMNPRLQAASELYRNPQTRPIAGQILQSELAKQGKKPEVVTIELGNGQKRSVLQNPDGTFSPLPANLAGGAQGDIPPDFEGTQKLRKEFQSQTNVKKFDDAIGAYKSMLTSAAKDSPQSDLDMVYGLAKILDPESVVREGEFATVRSSQAIPEQIRGYWQFLTEGKGKLPPQARAEIVGVAQSRLGAYRSQALDDVKRFEFLAQRYGMDPALIRKEFPELETFTAPAIQQPQQKPDDVIRWEKGPDGKPRRVQ
jgi:hypothetical protein